MQILPELSSVCPLGQSFVARTHDFSSFPSLKPLGHSDLRWTQEAYIIEAENVETIVKTIGNFIEYYYYSIHKSTAYYLKW